VNSWTPDTCRTLVDVAGDALRPGGLDLTEHLLGFGNFEAGRQVLDAGCGLGSTLHYLAKTRQVTAIGIDSSMSMIAAAQTRLSGVPLICAALESIPFPDARFDSIICECVLSQTEVSVVLGEFQRVLRSDGLLFVSDLYRRSLLPNVATGQMPGGQLATKEQIETVLNRNGFMIEHWEDHTSHLRRLAAQLIMASDNEGDSFCGMLGDVKYGINADCGFNAVGYHILVARKVTR
jgi:ubiquinone/menaquinone biosynthesis C-methylase UbiE